MTRRHRLLLFLGCVSIAVLGIGASAYALQQELPDFNTLSVPQRQPVALPSITAPSGQPGTLLEVPSLKLRNQPGFEQVTVTVTDSSGKYVTGLKEDDFRILEDGQQRPVGYFRIDRTAPVSIGIVVDCSSSMSTKMHQARRAIASLIDDLDPRDDIFLQTFSRQSYLLLPFTLDHAKVKDNLRFVHTVRWTGGSFSLDGTALYDAVYLGLLEMRHGARDKRALIVVTDGMNNSGFTSNAAVIAAAREMKVLLYTIGIGDEAANSEEGFFKFLRTDDDKVDMNTLRNLADESGARAFNLHRIGDGDELTRDCAAISDELRQQYTLAYVSPDPTRLSYRSLHVDVPKHPELSVRVRKGVAIVPPATK